MSDNDTYPLDPKLVKLLDPQFVAFYNQLMIKTPPVHELTPAIARIAYDASTATQIPEAELASIEDLEVAPEKAPEDDEDDELYEVPIRVYTPNGQAPAGGWPLYIHMHGGGWCIGSLETEHNHCTIWARDAKCVVVSIDYRLAPEHHFPAAHDDAWNTYRWIAQNAKKLNINLDKIAIGGTSAGGGLTAAVCHAISAKNAKHPDRKLPVPVRQILMVPSVNAAASVFDPTKRPTAQQQGKMSFINAPGLPLVTSKWFINMYIPNEQKRFDLRCAPLLHKDEDFKNQPPAQFHLAEIDTLTADGLLYAEKLKKAGTHVEITIHKGSPHIFTAFSNILDECKKMIEGVSDGLRRSFYREGKL